MDGPQFRLAAWIRGLRGKRIQCESSRALHPDAGSASPKDDVRAGIHRLAKETRRCIRSAVRIRLKVLCRAYGALPLFFAYPRRCRGLPCESRLAALGPLTIIR